MEYNLMALHDKIISPAWGNKPFEITQEFGTRSEDTAAMYPAEYTVPLGWPAGTHIGLDVSMPRGTPLFAINPGKVIQAGPSPFFRPNPVWIETADNPDTIKNESGYIEIYGHMWTNSVQAGDKVKIGQAIGTSGQQTHPLVDSSGNVIGTTMNPDDTGEHLHFELRKPEGGGTFKAVNPHSWLTGTQNIIDEDTPTEPIEEQPTNDMPSGISDLVKTLSERSAFILIGIILLGIGVVTVLKTA
jgi:murein DD-endopeptidase MepM/ murein hydrolase activator NlpD